MNRSAKGQRVAKGYRNAKSLFFFVLFLFNTQALALTPIHGYGRVTKHVTRSFPELTHLITAATYIAGLAFSVAAIFKFKQHKDNPTQINIGMPIGCLLVAASLLFFPTVLSVTGSTMYKNAQVSGPRGRQFDLKKIQSM